MKTVRDYYQYRDRLLEAVNVETDEALLTEIKNELQIVEEYITKIEKTEIEDLNLKKWTIKRRLII